MIGIYVMIVTCIEGKCEKTIKSLKGKVISVINPLGFQDSGDSTKAVYLAGLLCFDLVIP